MPKVSRVAVIGAGLAGLGCINTLKQEGLDPVCFEKSGYVGGLWRYREDASDGQTSVMSTTIINTSKEMGAMSNFPPPAEYANYMHHTKMYEYVLASVKGSETTQHVKFHHEVIKVEKTHDYEETGRWKVTCKNTQTKEIINEVYDSVIICIGHHGNPNFPTFPGQEEFKGKVMHSQALKNTKGFENLRIVIVGVGNSGIDAAVELSSVAKQVYLSSRRGTWVFPKVGPKGLPLDAVLIRRIYHFIFMRCLPFNIVCSAVEKFLNMNFDHTLYNLKPKHRALSQHPTQNDILPIKLLSGTVVTRGNIKTFTKDGVIFEGEECETQADAVIFCTGYKVEFPFLSEDILRVKENRVKLYRYIFPPDLPHPTLAILGQIQPNGPGIPAGEMQARWIARILRGKLTLPSKEKMHADIQKNEDFFRKRFTDSPRHTFQTDFLTYLDQLAAEIGAKPNLLKLAVTDPRLFWAVFFGPSLPYQYRLQGPHAWEGARDAILSYEERVRAPLQRPDQKVLQKKSNNFNLIMKLLILLPFIWLLFKIIFTT